MQDEVSYLKEAIRQKKALIESMEQDLQNVRLSLEKSLDRYIAMLEGVYKK
jgi:hypothetical protein